MQTFELFSFPTLSRRSLRLMVVALIVLGLLAWLVGTEPMFGLDLSQYQLIALPLVWIFCWKLRLVGCGARRDLLLVAIVGAVLSLSYSQLHVPDVRQAFVVARLADDEFEIRSRQFREKLNQEIRRIFPSSALWGERGASVFLSHSDASKFLAGVEQLPAVVWGTTRWINLTLHPERTASLRRDELEPWLTTVGLEIVPSVPVIGMTREPESDTARFLASSLIGMLGGRERTREGLSARAFHEIELLAAATQQSPWTSFAHRALPWFVLGNRHLVEAVRGGSYQPGELRCAIEAYTFARRSLRSGDNPELLAAALNNRAVAHSIMAAAERRPELRRLAKRGLRAAAKTIKEKNLYKVSFRAPKVARLNLLTLERRARLRRVRRADACRDTVGASGSKSTLCRSPGKAKRAKGGHRTGRVGVKD